MDILYHRNQSISVEQNAVPPVCSQALPAGLPVDLIENGALWTPHDDIIDDSSHWIIPKGPHALNYSHTQNINPKYIRTKILSLLTYFHFFEYLLHVMIAFYWIEK